MGIAPRAVPSMRKWTILIAFNRPVPLWRRHPAGSFESAYTPPKFRHYPPVANQLFRMLPSSNIMGAERKLERGSRWEKKGACQWNHSGRPSGWLGTIPAEHRYLSNSLQFLIANLELEFELGPKRISNLKISNRKFMTIFKSENWAASEFRRLQPTNSTSLARGSSHA